MDFKAPLTCLILLAAGTASAQDQAQQMLRQQQFDEQMRQGYERQQQQQQQQPDQQQVAPPPRPRAEFVNSYNMTFGAMAKAADDRQFAFSVGRYFASDAAAEAKDMCEHRTGQSCSVVQTFQNACATLAWPASLGRQPGKLSEVALAVKTTSEDSTKLAVAECEKISGAQCRVGYMACATPMLKSAMGSDVWSAIAIDPTTLKLFPALRSEYNIASARVAAYDLCQRDSGTAGNCEVLDHFTAGECRYLALSVPGIRDEAYNAIVRERSDPELAKRQCEAKAGSACKIVWHGCT